MTERQAPKGSYAGGGPPSESLAVSAGRNPWIAGLANLFLQPVGHLYAGAAQRGIVFWVARILVAAATALSVLALPATPALAVVAIAGVLTTLVPALDAFLVASRARNDFAPRSYNRGSVYAAMAVASIVAGMGVTALLRTQVQAFRMPSASMEPSVKRGDYFFVDKTRYRRQGPRRGDVVVHRFPGNPSVLFFKRVIGLPGETVEIRSKRVFIDGAPLEEPYAFFADATVRDSLDPRDQLAASTLGPGDYFLLGDNRDNSNDSRFTGPIDARSILGRGRFIYWSWDGERSAARWDRVGMTIE